jgi:outer membrane protein TolC
MDKQRVLEALNTLRAELADASGLDAASRANLERMTAAIEEQLHTGVAPEGDDDSLSGGLQDAVQEFGAEHPQVASAVNQVAAALANLGI